MVLGKKVAILDWEWGKNFAPRDGQKIPSLEYQAFQVDEGEGEYISDISIS